MIIKSGVSIVVPVFNSQDTLSELAERLSATFSSHGTDFEVLFVNDCSRDNSWAIICVLSKQYSWVKGINLMRNYGQHNALLCGIRVARYNIIVTIDDDLQHPPEEIPQLLNMLSQGYDVVYGSPRKEPHSLWRNLASKMTKLSLKSAIGTEMARSVSAFRAFHTRLRNAFAEYQSPFVSIDVLLAWGTTRFTAVSVRHDPRRVGQSNYTFRKLITHALNMTTGFSTFPLRLASFTGFGFTFFGFGVLIYVIGRYLIEGGSVPGFPFLASIIAVFSGTQLFALGIIGEYLARMHQRTMDKPVYTIRSVRNLRMKEHYLLCDEKVT